jgi:radical SAM protein with 4Fe4S-binding SPASM domain
MTGPVMTATRRANQELNIAEFQERRTELASRPLALFVELTRNCNLKCPSCRSAGPFLPEWNMSDEVFRTVADELFDSALLVDLRGYGESTILKNFPRAAHRVMDSGARLRLVTNGQVNKPELWDRMMAEHAVVVLSCDAASDDLFATLRAGGTLARLRETASTLVHHRDAHGAPRDLLSLYVVVSRPNLHELADIVTLADDLGIAQVSLAPIQIGTDHPWHLGHDVATVARSLDAATDRGRELGVRVQLASSLDESLNLDDDIKKMCMHPWAYAYISHEGRVGFCDHLIGLAKYTFGSLTEEPFMDIWNSERFQRLRRQHAEQDLRDEFSPCRWCYKRRYVDFEHLVHPSYGDHLVNTETRARLWTGQDAPACGSSFLGADQAETPASRRVLPIVTR